MTACNTNSSAFRPNGPDEVRLPGASNLFQFASSVLDYQQQMLGLTTLAADSMRLMIRQTQRQMEYMNALSQCRDFTAAGALTAEFMQKMGKEASGEWEEISHLAARWLNAANQNNRRVLEGLEASRRRA